MIPLAFRAFLTPLALLIFFSASAQQLQWTAIEPKTEAYFRSLSVVNDKVAWVGGSQGIIGRSVNGGVTWRFRSVPDFQALEFRSLYAFDSLTAVAANAGSPACIVRTTDGGMHWNVVYKNDHAQAFIDGMDFWNAREGLLYGDGIDHSMLLLSTLDGGITWKEIAQADRPVLKDGEASFAASGTGIRCVRPRQVFIATGGNTSRLWVSSDNGMHWKVVTPPIIQGRAMTGIFSIAFRDEKDGIITGGDFENDTLAHHHVYLTQDGGETWSTPSIPTGGLRECVEYLTESVMIAVGRGIDLSDDGGRTWKKVSGERSFSVVRKARSGKLIVLAGANGKISLLALR
jgi:photosystem II stability/assembly factor-like uncharacterized protein